MANNMMVKPKYQIEERVKFRKGNRILRGVIKVCYWYRSDPEFLIYYIASNKKTFRMIYEDDIIEKDTTNN